ncbi:aminopeptidase [Obelidium mucronatum]|nr:aminopeptidase [Obelidium mucronatum]
MTLIPRQHLYGNPERTSAQVNSDGSRIGFLAPKDGLLNVFVIHSDQLPTAVTNDNVRGIRIFGWTEHPDIVWFMQDKGGDEDWKVYTVNVTTGKEVCLTPTDKTTSRPVGVSKEFPDHALIMNNKRDPQFLDLYLINIHTAEAKLVLENDESFAGFTPDHEFSSVIASRVNADSSVDFYHVKLDTFSNNQQQQLATKTTTITTKTTKLISPESTTITTNKTTTTAITPVPEPAAPKASNGTHVLHLTTENAGYGDTGPQGFSADLSSIYFASFQDRNTSAFVKYNLTTKEITQVYGGDERGDISGSLINPVTHEPWAYQTNYARKRYVAIDETDAALAADFAVLDAQAGRGGDGEWNVESMSSDGSVWVIQISKSDHALQYYLYNRVSREASFLFDTRPVLASYKLNRMQAVEIMTRDGLTMLAYITIPRKYEGTGGKYSSEPIPLVAHVHGGPYARDEFGFNRFHQLLSDRGYAVISPQFRGSTGLGKAFLAAANGEWSGKMHDDIIDACDWAVENGIALKDKIAIHGGSYGGYCALVGVTFTPEYFACAVDIVGPSNICTLLDSIPAYWGPIKAMFTTRIGASPDTEEGRAFLLARSPISKVDNIVRPLLIGQGANDPRVKQAESDQIFNAMVEKKIPVTYFTAVTEAFLAKHLGGSFEQVGSDFDGSSIEFKGGREDIGL